MPRILCLFLGGALTLTACVPVLPQTFDRPRAAGGRLTGERYQPAAWVEFEVERARFAVRTEAGPEGGRWLVVRCALPGGVRCVWAAEAASVEIEGRTRSARFLGVSGNGNPALGLEPRRVLVGEDLRVAGRPTGFSRHFWLYFELPEDAPPGRVELPAFRLNGRPHRLPPIHFERQTDLRLLAPWQS
ncbi:MAG: hypothetical protein JSR82_19425 [Verrucomicrobia bacterium]|nr:hypothetical protein [Verrucomicrobiota bacterium]